MGPVSPDLGFCVPSLAEPRSPEPLSFIGPVIIGERESSSFDFSFASGTQRRVFPLRGFPLGELTAVASRSEWLSTSVEISVEC